MKTPNRSHLLETLRAIMREPGTPGPEIHTRVTLKTWQESAARHTADLAITPSPRRRVWALVHLAIASTLAATKAWHNGDPDGVEAWRASGIRAVVELEAIKEYGSERWPTHISLITRLHMEGDRS
jgi:hypothetical protein